MIITSFLLDLGTPILDGNKSGVCDQALCFY